jgi:hypothetical protein
MYVETISPRVVTEFGGFDKVRLGPFCGGQDDERDCGNVVTTSAEIDEYQAPKGVSELCHELVSFYEKQL